MTVFLDIETVPVTEFLDLNNEWQVKLWSAKIAKEEGTPEELWPRAGLYAEFGKIICISTGYIMHTGQKHIKSFFGEEKELLTEFSKYLSAFHGWKLCAHNGKSFDFPYIARRMIINSIPVPTMLNTLDKKPWETSLCDTMEMWRFGDFKYYASLDLLCYALGVETPKNGIDGSKVYEVYYKQNGLETIVRYCEQDVRAMMEVHKKISG